MSIKHCFVFAWVEKQPKEEKRAPLQGAVEQQDGGFTFVPTASRQKLPLLKFNTSLPALDKHTGTPAQFVLSC